LKIIISITFIFSLLIIGGGGFINESQASSGETATGITGGVADPGHEGVH
jgi:hypothetical protein